MENNEECEFGCPECHETMVRSNTYKRFCSQIGEIVTVENYFRPYWECPKCHHTLTPMDMIDEWHRCINRRIEEWTFSHIHSFEDMTKYLFTKRQALGYIKRQSKKIKCDDNRFKPFFIKNFLKWHWYFYHVMICGQMYFLKKSIIKYCETGDGSFPLSEGIEIQENTK